MNPYSPAYRHSKIICTLGPSSNTHGKISAMARAGMDVARLNFSHGTYSEHKKKIKIIRKVAAELEKPIAILQYLQGPKIRIQNFKKGFIHLNPGQSFILTTRQLMGDNKIVSVSYDLFHNDVSPGDIVLLDDGLLKLEVEKISGQDVFCKVIFGGKLSDKKGINLPGNILSVNALTAKDIKDLEFGLESDVDYIGFAACDAADVIGAKAIICLTQTGSTAQMIARFRPKQRIIAVTPSEHSLRRLALIWGVNGFLVKDLKDNMDDAIDDLQKYLKNKGIVHAGDQIIITAGLPFFSRGGTNMLRIEEIK